ncbi:DUF6461 domain-containing protein [Streptomyces sp. NPDC093084]|uniref:DUF6461 domain-containing protein n=1 Tax=Streptomyces sp. NPDC093084 TaxID=3155197 RepID=UPI00341E1278
MRAGSHDEWSFVIEAETTYLAADAVLPAISHGTAALSLREPESGATWIAYAENGDVLNSFDPLYPDTDYGRNPDRLEQLTGYREAINNGERADAFISAARTNQQQLRCTIPPRPMPASCRRSVSPTPTETARAVWRWSCSTIPLSALSGHSRRSVRRAPR